MHNFNQRIRASLTCCINQKRVANADPSAHTLHTHTPLTHTQKYDTLGQLHMKAAATVASRWRWQAAPPRAAGESKKLLHEFKKKKGLNKTARKKGRRSPVSGTVNVYMRQLGIFFVSFSFHFVGLKLTQISWPRTNCSGRVMCANWFQDLRGHEKSRNEPTGRRADKATRAKGKTTGKGQ